MNRAMAMALLLAGGAARAEVPPIRVDVGYAAQVVTHRAFDFVAHGDHLPMFRVAAGTSFELAPGAVDAQLAFLTGSTSADAHSVTASLWLRGVELSAQYRHPIWRVLHGYGRVGASWDWATLQLGSLEQTTSAPAGLLRAGLQARFPVAFTTRLGAAVFDVGIGYTLRPAFTFDAVAPKPPDDPPADPLQEGALDLGALPMSGISYAVTFGLQF